MYEYLGTIAVTLKKTELPEVGFSLMVGTPATQVRSTAGMVSILFKSLPRPASNEIAVLR
jgi:hypothetical protein